MLLSVRKKIILRFVASTMFAIYCNNLKAQHVILLYGHGIYATPTDKNFKRGYNTGVGIEGGGGIGWNKTFIIGTIGYTHFFKESDNSAGDAGIVPFKAGLRQYIFSKLIYIHGDVGIDKIKNKISSDSRFSADIGAGIRLGLLELQIDYDGFTRDDPSGFASWVGFKAGFAFGL
jgi:hypothetical protein